MFNGVQRENN